VEREAVANNIDFIVKNGLQVSSNLTVGAYANSNTVVQSSNGMISSGNVGVGTSIITSGTRLMVAGGNINLNSNSSVATGYGIVFPDGSFQTSASTSGYSSSGSAGTVQFAGSSGSFNGNSGNFFWDNTNFKLGIGTGSPTNTISVFGGTPAWFATTNGANTYETIVGSGTGTSSSLGYNSASPYGYLKLSGQTTALAFNSSGQVGVGAITAPKNTLDVGNNMAIGINYAGVATAPLYSLLVQGNVGIGTTNPGARLTIVNNNAPQVALSNAIIDAEGQVNNYAQINIRNASNGTAASSDFVATADTGSDGFNYIDMGINGSQFSQAGWSINGPTDGYLYTSDGNLSIGTANSSVTTTYLNFFTSGTLAANERMRIDGNGNVGIGTTGPLSTLDVNGAASFRSNINVVGTRSTFSNYVGIGTSTAAGMGNVLSVYGNTNHYGNIQIKNTAAGPAGIYFADGTFLNTAANTYTSFSYTGDGVTNTYSTSPITASSVNNTMVYVNGVYQRKNQYGWAGTTITFSGIPPADSVIEINCVQAINAPFGVTDFTASGNLTVSGGVISTGTGTGSLFNTIATTLNIGGAATTISLGAATGTTTLNSTTASTSTSNGALVLKGGEGIAGNLNVGGAVSTFAGNVGIGTTLPAYPLSVNGYIQSTSGGFIFPDGSTLSSAVGAVSVFDYTANGSTTTYSTGNYAASTTAATYVFVGGVYQRKNQYAWSGTNIIFNTAPPNGANIEIMVNSLTTSIGVANDGSVTPVKLSSGGPSWDTRGNLSVTGNIVSLGNVVLASNGTQFWGPTIDSAATPGFTWNGDTGTGISNPSTGNLVLGTGGLEWLRVSPFGNVLIGTTSYPSDKAIAVVINSSGNTAAGGGGVQFAANNNGGGAIQGTVGGGLQFWTYTGAIGSETYIEPMVIDVNGNVGINTTSVTTGYKTEINGNVKVDGIVASNTVNLNIQTTNYNVSAYDSGGVIVVNSGSAVTVTVPTQAAGFRTMILRQGAGTVTLSGSGVTLQSRTGAFAVTAQYGSVSVLFVSTSVAIIDGSV